LGAFSLLIALGSILVALAFQYIGGYEPCPLCLTERYAYYAGIPLLFLSLVILSAGRPSIAAVGFGLVALAFFANAALGGYHAGAEWGFWPGPSTCSGALAPLGSPADLLKGAAQITVIRCDQASWRMFGLSFAGWNAVISAGLGISAFLAMRGTFQGPVYSARRLPI
jgi:disulfide bond formation protein DsbB